jgi:hypothetical protein
MPNLTELLRDAVGEPTSTATFDELESRAAERRVRRHRRRAIAASACVVALVAVTGIVVRTRSGSHQRVATEPSPTIVTTTPPPIVPPPSGPVFSALSGDVLAFDNGYDEITLVDMDHRVAIRRIGVGETAGDQPVRIARVGTDLLVGTGQIYAAPIAGGPSRPLGETTVYLPAVEPDRVWFVEYPNNASAAPHAKFVVASTGAVLADVTSPFQGDASIGAGVQGGLARVRTHGLDIWHLATQSVVARLGDPAGGQGETLDAVGSKLAWCQEDAATYACDTLHVTDLAAKGGPSDTIVRSYPGRQVTSARLSPDGKIVAVATYLPRIGQPGNPQQGTGTVTVEGPGLHRQMDGQGDTRAMAWSVDGARLYMTVGSYEQTATSLSMWTVATDTIEHADLPFGGLAQMVTASASDLGSLPDHTRSQSECTAVLSHGTGGFQECAFGF